jgi:DNA repair exonuclease SbcCD nuclease subunit
MRRVAVIGDLHLGKTLYGYDLTPHVRRAMYEFLDLCVELRVDSAVCLGDVYDRPAPTAALQKIVVQWCNEFERAAIDLHLLVGNHDATSSAATPSALEPLRVVAPFKHVCVVDRPTIVQGVGMMLPFPSPGIFHSEDDYTAAVAALPGVAVARAYSHLNIDGAKVGEQAFPYRGAEHGLPEGDPWDLLIGGHIHKPQRIRSRAAWLPGAAERLSFAEKDEPRTFAVIDGVKPKAYLRASALRLVGVELDVSGWGNVGGSPPTTADVLRELEPRVDGALVKLAPIVDDRTVVDWPAVERGLLAAGAVMVTITPSVQARREVRKVNRTAATDAGFVAARFIKQRIQDKHEQKRLLRTFEQIRKEVDHGEREVRG